MSNDTRQSFECSSCGKAYSLTDEIAGRTLRCDCGAKLSVPDLADDSSTAAASLEDTVADVVLEEQFDAIEHEENAQSVEEETQTTFRRIHRRGVFGWPMGGEVLFFGVGSVLGFGCVILAAIVGQYFWPYIAASVVIGPYSWLRLYHSWGYWTQGRPWMECMLAALSGEETDDQEEL